MNTTAHKIVNKLKALKGVKGVTFNQNLAVVKFKGYAVEVLNTTNTVHIECVGTKVWKAAKKTNKALMQLGLTYSTDCIQYQIARNQFN